MGASLHTHYDTLGVARGASPEAVRQSYRRRAQSCHPDKLAAPGDASEPVAAQDLMARINQAYAVLSDPAGRATYDRWLAAHDELLAAQRAVAAAARRGPLFAWPWAVLGGTLAFSMLTVGTVVYKEMVPPVVAPPGPAQSVGAAPAGRRETPGVPTGPGAGPPRDNASPEAPAGLVRR